MGAGGGVDSLCVAGDACEAPLAAGACGAAAGTDLCALFAWWTAAVLATCALCATVAATGAGGVAVVAGVLVEPALAAGEELVMPLPPQPARRSPPSSMPTLAEAAGALNARLTLRAGGDGVNRMICLSARLALDGAVCLGPPRQIGRPAFAILPRIASSLTAAAEEGDTQMADINDFNRAIIEEFRSHGGKVGGPFAGTPVLLLSTIGAKSGEQRTTPVVYLPDGERMIIFASKAGAPENPAWYHNIRANPTVTVEVGNDSFAANATVLDGEERDRLFERQAELHPQFDEYAQRTSRVIPVIALARAA